MYSVLDIITFPSRKSIDYSYKNDGYFMHQKGYKKVSCQSTLVVSSTSDHFVTCY